jgi:hypothetical protein
MKMNKTLLVLTLVIAAPSIYAQSSTTTDPSAPKSREEVKSEIPGTGAKKTHHDAQQKAPASKSGKSREQVKSEIPATGAQKTQQTEDKK